MGRGGGTRQVTDLLSIYTAAMGLSLITPICHTQLTEAGTRKECIPGHTANGAKAQTLLSSKSAFCHHLRLSGALGLSERQRRATPLPAPQDSQ